MPKAPILNRECFYDTLGDGTLRFLDFCLVNTELGAMVEPRSLLGAQFSQGLAHVDLRDASFNKMSAMKEDEFYQLTNHSGRQIPVDFQ